MYEGEHLEMVYGGRDFEPLRSRALLCLEMIRAY